MEIFESLLNFLDSLLGSAIYFPFLLLGVGLFFTLYLGFPQLRFFAHAWVVLLGKHTPEGAEAPKPPGPMPRQTRFRWTSLRARPSR